MIRPVSTVSPAGLPDKRTAVRDMFGRIAGRYDRMNALMTAGLDGYWRRRTARAAELPEGGIALDIGTGTGDLAFALARSAPGAHVIGADYTPEMLRLAPAKAAARSLAGQTSWSQADGQALPFYDGAFDAVTSAFVLRNFADLGAALSEMARVVRPGGRVVALEISPTETPLWSPLFRLYFERLVPLVGRLVAGDDTAYRYLPASVAAFLTPEAVAERMRSVGLAPLTPYRLMLGSVVIHVGVRPRDAAVHAEAAAGLSLR
jgi:demethylmenaquinone methyltransferase/2-methoxy-6-polyprenyl-1,4-benzoquinol methylase